jgi:hypothetical protein
MSSPANTFETHDPEIPYVLYELARELEKMEKKSEATK